MLKKNLERVVTELEGAELQPDLTIKVDTGWEVGRGTRNYSDFRTFCDEIIRRIRTG